ncbi:MULTISPECIES: BRO family protein [Enterobacter cloacae complex]|uniref:BRO family protein n=2 Tax=Enterobacteriaceae TaxID=543 RepID=UPI0007C6718E|nr:BRO family, N-terminal domain protein [Enterobacter roggenkampii]
MLKHKNVEAQRWSDRQASVSNKSSDGSIDMNIVHNYELTFQNINFAYMEVAGQIWLTAAQVGEALGYSDDKAIHRLYRKHADEFTANMTGVVKVTTPGGVQDSRVFSLRGAHLMGMFSRTPVAKEFRRWVLDVLDREVQHSPIAKQFSDEELVSLCYLQLWMERSQLVSKNLYPAMKQAKSEYAGALYDIAHDIHYMTVETKKILLREAKNLDDKNFVVSHAQPMLAKLRGEDGWIH